MLNETIYNHARGRGEHIFRMGEDVFDERGGDNTQRDFAVNAAEGEVVDFISKGRNVGALSGIDVDGEDVLSVEIEVRSQIERERRVSTFVFAEACAVDPYG